MRRSWWTVELLAAQSTKSLRHARLAALEHGDAVLPEPWIVPPVEILLVGLSGLGHDQFAAADHFFHALLLDPELIEAEDFVGGHEAVGIRVGRGGGRLVVGAAHVARPADALGCEATRGFDVLDHHEQVRTTFLGFDVRRAGHDTCLNQQGDELGAEH